MRQLFPVLVYHKVQQNFLHLVHGSQHLCLSTRILLSSLSISYSDLQTYVIYYVLWFKLGVRCRYVRLFYYDHMLSVFFLENQNFASFSNLYITQYTIIVAS